jgi:hypothetical protein
MQRFEMKIETSRQAFQAGLPGGLRTPAGSGPRVITAVHEGKEFKILVLG